MNNIEKLTYDFVYDLDDYQLPIKIQDLESMLSCLGFMLVPMSTFQRSVNLPDECYQQNAFCYIAEAENASFKFVVYKDNLSYSDKLLSISHELGHIVIGHRNFYIGQSDYKNDEQEKEADVFALTFLAPIEILKTKEINSIESVQENTLLDKEHAYIVYARLKEAHPDDGRFKLRLAFIKTITVVASLSIVMAIIVGFIGDGQNGLEEYEDYKITSTQPIIITTNSTDQPETVTHSTTDENHVYTVIVNKNSKVYHIDEDCPAVKRMNEENRIVVSGTIKELEEMGYKACGTCSR